MKCETYCLGNVCTFIDYRGKTPPKTTSGIPLITAKIVKNGAIQEPQEFIAESYYDEWMRRGIPKQGSVVFTTEAPLGEVARIRTNDKLAFAQRIIVLESKQQYLNPDYLFYSLQDCVLKSRIEARATGTTVIGIKAAELKRVEIDLPPLLTQKQIAAVLCVLDDKIELNNKINDNLEQQIEAIFNNKYAPSLCCPNWVVGTIGDVVTLQRGYDLPRDKMVSGSYPVAGSTDTIFYHNEYTTEAPCVVMGRSGNIGKPRLYMERCWAHNTTLFVKDFKGNNPYWSYYMLRSIDYSQFRGGSAVPTLNRNHVHSFEISIPPVNQQNEFAEIILPLLLLIENNRKEIKRLSTLRQALLPKLMAGEIDISDIDL